MSASPAPELIRLVYRSRSTLDGAASEVERDLAAILERARARNAAAEVTGALMFTRLMFVQALEGPAAAMEDVFERICRDPRHADLEVIEYAVAGERVFGDWSMRHLVPDAQTEAQVALAGEGAGEHGGENGGDAATAALRLMRALLSCADSPAPTARAAA